MADVQARAGGIRELDQAEELRLALVGLCLKGMRIGPVFLPFELDLVGIVGFDVHRVFLLTSSSYREPKSAPARGQCPHPLPTGLSGRTALCPRPLLPNKKHPCTIMHRGA